MNKMSKEIREYVLEELTKIDKILQSCINANGNWKVSSKKAESINQIQIDLYNNIKEDTIKVNNGYSEHV